MNAAIVTPRVDPSSRDRLRVAAFRATTLYPGPVGRLGCRELLSWADFGHRLGGHAFGNRLAAPGDGAVRANGGDRS